MQSLMKGPDVKFLTKPAVFLTLEWMDCMEWFTLPDEKTDDPLLEDEMLGDREERGFS